MDTLSIALCISIGSCVAWLIALYRPDGTSSLLWHFPLGMAGAALCALAIARFAPWLGVAGLVIAGPFGAVLMIVAGEAIVRALRRPIPPARS
jgi:hypothetical protein